MYYPTERFPTETAMEQYLQTFVFKLNSDEPVKALEDPTFGSVIDRFTAEEHLEEIKAQRPGQRCEHDLSYGTAVSYLSVLKHIREKWGKSRVSRVKPAAVQEWLKAIKMSPKTKGHIKALMHRLFEKAILWEMIDLQRNPMQLVEVKGISKRLKRPIVLTVEQFYAVVDLLPQPYRTMVIVAQCLGLRAEEVLALHWSDIDFGREALRVTRAVVHGRVKTVKTEYSEDELPLDPNFATILRAWKTLSSPSELVFPSEVTGRSYHASPIQQDYIRPAGSCLIQCPECGAASGIWCADEGTRVSVHTSRREAAGKFDHVGWHTFRHTYRSWLDAGGAPLGVQQKLMRHAQISTTMNVYGNALMDSKREANSKVARMVLRSDSSVFQPRQPLQEAF